MEKTQVYGLYGEGRILCLSCARRIYGTSQEKYMRTGDLQVLCEEDRGPYAGNGLLCDECLRWIFQPDGVEMPWWQDEPTVEEHLRLLAPFTSCLEKLGVDVSNLREAAAVRSC
jgi:hypothetical protein